MTSRYIAAVRMSMAFIVVYLAVFTMVLCLTCRPFVSFFIFAFCFLLSFASIGGGEGCMTGEKEMTI